MWAPVLFKCSVGKVQRLFPWSCVDVAVYAASTSQSPTIHPVTSSIASVWVLWGDCLRNRPEVYTGTLSALSLLLCRWTWKIVARWQISAVHSDTVIRNKHCSLFIFEIRVRWRPKQKRTLSTARSHSKPVRRACNVNPGLTKTEFTCMGRFLSEPEFSLFSLFCGSFWETGVWKILDLHHSQSTSADIFDFTFGSIPPGCFPRKANKWIYADLRYFGRGANE